MSCPCSWKELFQLVAESTKLISVLNNVKWRSFPFQRILAAGMKRDRKKSHVCIAYVQSLLLSLVGSSEQTSRATLKELPIFSEFSVCLFMTAFLKERPGTFCIWKIARHCYSSHFSCICFATHTWLVCLMPFQMFAMKLAVMDDEVVVEQMEQIRQKWQTLLAWLNPPLPWQLCTIPKTVNASELLLLSSISFWGLARDTDKVTFTHRI